LDKWSWCWSISRMPTPADDDERQLKQLHRRLEAFHQP